MQAKTPKKAGHKEENVDKEIESIKKGAATKRSQGLAGGELRAEQ